MLLSDAVSRGTKLGDITTQVIWRMSERLDLPNLDMFPYFDFRSEAEQAALNEPEWAAAS